MLSYRHAYHAGNHADVLKHWLLVLCLQYMKKKEKPFLYLDTHAGAGRYMLTGAHADKNGEYRNGIARLWHDEVPPALGGYLDCIRQCNTDALVIYPGSPQIAQQLLRDQDSLCFAELHSTDVALLRKNSVADARVRVMEGDGFDQIKALLPPPVRRGLVLIDPPYEIKSDYQRVIQALGEGLKRFATGTYLVWYPLLNSPNSQQFAEQLKSVAGNKWLKVELQVMAKPQDLGMYGSGMFALNPPYVLPQQLRDTLPWLAARLAQDDAADWAIEVSDAD